MTATNEQTGAFRDALYAVIERVGFPHETDVAAAKAAVSEFLGYEVEQPPFTGPWFDPATGAYIGPENDPHNPATTVTATSAGVPDDGNLDNGPGTPGVPAPVYTGAVSGGATPQ